MPQKELLIFNQWYYLFPYKVRSRNGIFYVARKFKKNISFKKKRALLNESDETLIK